MMLVVLLLLLGTEGSQSISEQTVLCGRALAKAHSMYCYGTDHFSAATVHSDIPFSLTSERSNIPDRFTVRAQRTTEAPPLTMAELFEACCLKPCTISEVLNRC